MTAVAAVPSRGDILQESSSCLSDVPQILLGVPQLADVLVRVAAQRRDGPAAHGRVERDALLALVVADAADLPNARGCGGVIGLVAHMPIDREGGVLRRFVGVMSHAAGWGVVPCLLLLLHGNGSRGGRRGGDIDDLHPRSLVLWLSWRHFVRVLCVFVCYARWLVQRQRQWKSFAF